MIIISIENFFPYFCSIHIPIPYNITVTFYFIFCCCYLLLFRYVFFYFLFVVVAYCWSCVAVAVLLLHAASSRLLWLCSFPLFPSSKFSMKIFNDEKKKKREKCNRWRFFYRERERNFFSSCRRCICCRKKQIEHRHHVNKKY